MRERTATRALCRSAVGKDLGVDVGQSLFQLAEGRLLQIESDTGRSGGCARQGKYARQQQGEDACACFFESHASGFIFGLCGVLYNANV